MKHVNKISLLVLYVFFISESCGVAGAVKSRERLESDPATQPNFRPASKDSQPSLAPSFSFLDLPKELQFHMMDFMPIKDRLRLQSASRECSEMGADYENGLVEAYAHRGRVQSLKSEHLQQAISSGIWHQEALLGRPIFHKALLPILRESGGLYIADVASPIYLWMRSIAAATPMIQEFDIVDTLGAMVLGVETHAQQLCANTVLRVGLEHSLGNYNRYKLFGTAQAMGGLKGRSGNLIEKLRADLQTKYAGVENIRGVCNQDIIAPVMALAYNHTWREVKKYFLYNPNNTLVLDIGPLDAETLDLPKQLLPETVQHLAITNSGRNLHTTAHSFLEDSVHLKTLDMTSLAWLKTIRWGFLMRCESLNSFDPSGFASLETIEEWFMRGCKSLRKFDTMGLERVQEVGGWFLKECDSLQRFNGRGFRGVKKVGGFFLTHCHELTEFHGAGFDSLLEIGKHFLAHSAKIRIFNSAGLEAVEKIGSFFLPNAPSLAWIDLSGFRSLREVREKFLLGAPKLDPREVIDPLRIIQRFTTEPGHND